MKQTNKKAKAKKSKSMNLSTCSGAGRTLRKSTSKGLKSAAGRKLSKCKLSKCK